MNFDETKHEYELNGVTYISVTQLLKKYGLSADYAGIPDAVLQAAAAKGSAIHKALEKYINGDQTQLSVPQVGMFANYIAMQNIDLTHAKSEEIVYDTNYRLAGTVDFQYMENGDTYIADFKTTSQLHIDAVAWQLSIYNYLVTKGDLMMYYFNKLKVYHFNNGKMFVKDIHTIDYDTVKALLEANLSGASTFQYVKTNKLITPSDETVVAQMLTEIQNYEEALTKVKGELDVILERVKENFIREKEYSYKTGAIEITYVAPSTRKSLATAKVKQFIEDHGGKVEDFMNETVTADSIRISLAKTKGPQVSSGD